MSSATDEIFDKYLQKAIAEINELGEEITRAAGEGACRLWVRAIRSRT